MESKWSRKATAGRTGTRIAALRGSLAIVAEHRANALGKQPCDSSGEMLFALDPSASSTVVLARHEVRLVAPLIWERRSRVSPLWFRFR